MSDPLLEEGDASTHLTEEERDELIPSYITLRSELNEAEQRNILEAEEWAFKRQRNVLSEHFLNELHKSMFGKVWRWSPFTYSNRFVIGQTRAATLTQKA